MFFLCDISGWISQAGKHRWGCCWWEGLTVRAKVLAGEPHFFQMKNEVSFFSRQSVRKEQRKRGSGGADWDVTHCLDLSAVSFPLMALSPALKRLSRGGERREVARTQTREQIGESLCKLKTLKASSVPKKITSQIMPQRPERVRERRPEICLERTDFCIRRGMFTKSDFVSAVFFPCIPDE